MTRTSTAPLLTLEQARAGFDTRGESIAAFARRHNLPASVIYQVLYGVKKGRRGLSHRAAVALGIKAGERAAKA